MNRKISKPSLKNYLSTGKVVIEVSNESCDASMIIAGENTDGKAVNVEKLLELFSSEDSNTWGPVFMAGARINILKTDLVELRELFRTMDRIKFTMYILENEKSVMRIIRSGVQIREPYILFLLWDDEGVASVYVSDENRFN